MNNEECVKYCFESQRPMTKEEEYEYYKLQWEKYWSKFVPMTPCIDVREVLKGMIAKGKSGKKQEVK